MTPNQIVPTRYVETLEHRNAAPVTQRAGRAPDAAAVNERVGQNNDSPAQGGSIVSALRLVIHPGLDGLRHRVETQRDPLRATRRAAGQHLDRYAGHVGVMRPWSADRETVDETRPELWRVEKRNTEATHFGGYLRDAGNRPVVRVGQQRGRLESA